MGERITGPARGVSPCAGCARPWKQPGCHDKCQDFKSWKEEAQKNKKAKEEYLKSRFSYPYRRR